MNSTILLRSLDSWNKKSNVDVKLKNILPSLLFSKQFSIQKTISLEAQCPMYYSMLIHIGYGIGYMKAKL